MKKLFQIIILTCCVALFSFCKKQSETGIDNEEIFTYNSSFGVTQNYNVINNALVKNGRYPNVFISKQSSKTKIPSSVKIDSLYFNSSPLSFVSDNFYTMSITDTLPQTIATNLKWKVIGSLEFASFTELMPDSFPRFTKYNVLPDSVSRTGTTLMQLGGANFNDVYIRVVDAQSHEWVTSVDATSSNAAITSPTALSTTATGNLTISFSQKYSKTIDGKTIYFIRSSAYKKQIKIIN